MRDANARADLRVIQDMDSASITPVFTLCAVMRLQSKAAMGLANSLLSTC